MTDFILECNNVSKNFGQKYALHDVSLQLPRGRVVGLLGPNGSGKSTLIKLINGLLTPTSGTIFVGGHAPGVESKQLVSYLPERTYLNDWMRVSDTLSLFCDFYSDFRLDVAKDMLKRLDIDIGMRLKAMSKGTKEKVQLILVMSRAAQLYLLDEPIGGVDPAARDFILNTIIGNYSENATVILATHLIADVEKVLDDVLFLSKGSIVLSESVDTIRERRGQSVDALFREVFRC